MFGEVHYWVEAGVDGFRLDAITTLVHDHDLRDNPVRAIDPNAPPRFADANNPFTWQDLIYTRDQPRTLELLGQLRSLVDRYENRYLIGEVADVDMITVSAKYTRTGKHLHSCYNFELMPLAFSATFLKGVLEKTESVLDAGWTTWAMSNHDNIRVVSRFGRLPHLQGNGLTEAEIAFADLQDPYGIEFWPEFKGRDGCRTPMPWSSHLPNAGFSQAAPWLPVPKEHFSLAVDQQENDQNSVLAMFQSFLAWRKKRPALVRGDFSVVEATDPVLAFERSLDGERILCVFNFSNREASQPASRPWRSIAGQDFGATIKGEQIVLPPFGAWFGEPA